MSQLYGPPRFVTGIVLLSVLHLSLFMSHYVYSFCISLQYLQDRAANWEEMYFQFPKAVF
jgi:hypothetical protein